MVHDPDAREARRLGRRRDRAQTRAQSRPHRRPTRTPGAAARTAARLVPSACAAASAVARATRAGAVRTTAGSSTMSNSRARASRCAFELAHLPCQHTIGDDLAARAVAGATLGRGGREHDSHARDVVPAGECDPCGPPLGLEPERVDHRRQPPPQPLGDDRVEQRERVGAGREVLFAFADDRPQVVARHDLLGREVARCAHDDFPAPDGPTSTTRHGAGSTTDSVSSIPSDTPRSSAAPPRLPARQFVIRVEKPALDADFGTLMAETADAVHRPAGVAPPGPGRMARWLGRWAHSSSAWPAVSRPRRGCGPGSWPRPSRPSPCVVGIVPWRRVRRRSRRARGTARVPRARGAARGAPRRGRVLRRARGVDRHRAAPAPRAVVPRGRGHGAVQPRRRGRAAHTAVRAHRAPPRRRRHRARVHPRVARVAGVVGASGVEPHQPRARRSTAPRSRRLPRARGSGRDRGDDRRLVRVSPVPPESNRPTSLHPSSSTGTHCESARRSSRSSCSASRLATRSASRRGSSPGSRSRPSAHGLDGSRGDTSHLPRSRWPSRSARSRSVPHRLSTSTASCRSTARRGRHSRSERRSSARTR